jgi:hypothetical protein
MSLLYAPLVGQVELVREERPNRFGSVWASIVPTTSIPYIMHAAQDDGTQ